MSKNKSENAIVRVIFIILYAQSIHNIIYHSHLQYFAYISRNYADTNEKPLLGDTSPDNDEWAGWVDEWKEDGSKSSASQPSITKDQEEPWEDWSNQGNSSQSSATNHKELSDDWNNDGWDDTPLTATDSRNSQSASRAKHKPHASKARSSTGKKNPAEPATANLIDFGNGATNNTGAEEGWDNEVWAAEDEDDVWQTLELDPAPAKTSNYKAKSKKGD